MVNPGEFVGGAALGGAFGAAVDVVKETMENILAFDSKLEDVTYTVESLQPLTGVIEGHNTTLGGRQDDIKQLKETLDRGKELIGKLSAVHNWSPMKAHYTEQLDEADQSIDRSLKTLQVQGVRDTKENLVLTKENLVLTKESKKVLEDTSLLVKNTGEDVTEGLKVTKENRKVGEETLELTKALLKGLQEMERILSLATLHETQAIEYIVENRALSTPGGIRFRDEIGVDYTKQTMRDATEFIWNLFKETTAAERRDTPRISMFIEDLEAGGIASSSGDIIHVSDDFIQRTPAADLKKDFNWMTYHEVTHSLQRNGQGQAPVEVVEGIAEFVTLKSTFIPASFAAPGAGQRWDEGYSVTARFLEYCDGLKSGFVAELNKKMIDGYSNDFFNQLLGKTVDQLWTDYKAKYAN